MSPIVPANQSFLTHLQYCDETAQNDHLFEFIQIIQFYRFALMLRRKIAASSAGVTPPTTAYCGWPARSAI